MTVRGAAEVLIVGGGPVGLSLAGDLGSRGVSTLLIEQSDGTIVQPKMDMVGVRTMEFCRRWGLLDAVRNAPYPLDYRQDCIWGTSVTGYEFGREPFAARGEEKPAMGSPERRQRCPQDMFDPILLAFARRQDAVTVRHKCRLQGFEQRPDRVVASIEDLASGEVETVECSYLVGCDGAGSTVRTQLGITLSGNPALTYTTNIIFRSAALKHLHDKGQFYRFIAFDERGMWATLVAINGRDDYRVSIVGSDQPRRYSADEIGAAIRKLVGSDFAFEILSVVPWVRRLMVADRYGSERAWLAGDAVHMLSPTGAFGMNTGIQDAVDLAWKLDAVLTGWGGPHLLTSYELERRPVAIRNVVEASVEGAQARAAFGRKYTAIMRREWFSSGINLGYRYENSPIVVADGTPQPADDPAIHIQTSRPGHRAPHVSLSADGRSTLDLFGNGFVLLTLGDEAPDPTGFVAAATARDVPVTVFASSQPDLVFTYERPLVLVRPDGHVAWRGNAFPHDLDDLLATICGFKRPGDGPRPELAFGQKGVFLTPARQTPDTGDHDGGRLDEQTEIAVPIATTNTGA